MFEKPELKDIKIPRLNPTLRLFRAESDTSGSPRWRLYHALSNTYFDIGWIEFEALSRFSSCENALELRNQIEEETPLQLEDDDIPSLIQFLEKNGLLSTSDTFSNKFEPKKHMPLWKKVVHNYLFFSIPLFKPNAFLKKSWPIVKPLFSDGFFKFSMLVLFIFSIMTLGRIDEFLTTFFMFFSLEGIITITVVFFFIKILHEFGHAYTAYKNGVDVPHMGLAFIIMYPILYTETTGAWRLDSRIKRMGIGLAGIRTELIIAAYALALWHFLAPGVAQSLAFSVVAISLTGSLLINLNPLMRFDGYFVLSDYLGIENLHGRSFTAARWFIRKTLFGLPEELPEDNKARLRFLIYFGWAVLIYRFFLFMGIAILVYHIFFKPLGLFLMIVEITWFILLPIWSEVKVWIAKRQEILAQKRSKVTFGILTILLFIGFLPSSNSVTLPAVAHMRDFTTIYPPVSAKIDNILIQDNQSVSEGDVLMKLSAPQLEKNLKLARIEKETLEREKRQLQSNGSLSKERLSIIDIEIETARKNLQSFQEQAEDLTIRAEFSGTIRDLNTDIAEQQFVTNNTILFRLIRPSEQIITAFVSDYALERIENGNKAVFRAYNTFFPKDGYQVQSIDVINTEELNWPELSSIYGGVIPSEFSTDNKNRIIPRQSLYKLVLTPKTNIHERAQTVQKGYIYIEGDRQSPLISFITFLGQIFIREINLN